MTVFSFSAAGKNSKTKIAVSRIKAGQSVLPQIIDEDEDAEESLPPFPDVNINHPKPGDRFCKLESRFLEPESRGDCGEYERQEIELPDDFVRGRVRERNTQTGKKDEGVEQFNEVWSKMFAKKMNTISYRLMQKKILLWRQRFLLNVAGVLAFVGWACMIVETELYLNIIFEHVICALHPPPGDLGTETDSTLESILSIVMFLRLYLVARLLVVHSKLVTDSCKSTLALNKLERSLFLCAAVEPEWVLQLVQVLEVPVALVDAISLSAKIFAVSVTVDTNQSALSPRSSQLRHRLASQPCQMTTLCKFWGVFWRHEARYLQNSMYLAGVTFLAVGYGDIVPVSTCGRITAVVTGLMGVALTAMLVAVMAQRLEQSRAEKYVHVFMLRSRLEQSHREKAADVIKWALMLWTSRLKGRKIPAHVRIYYHSKMLQ
ncbi:hypothetical protein BaRGS_00034725, partial [Batillaria attramentaria]